MKYVCRGKIKEGAQGAAGSSSGNVRKFVIRINDPTVIR